MKKTVYILISLTGLLRAAPPAFAAYEWDRYQLILEREPFGQKLMEPADPQTPQQNDPQLAAQYRLSMLYTGRDGEARAGLVRKQGNTSIILRPNEPQKNVELIRINYLENTAVFRESGLYFELKLDSAGAKPAVIPQPKETVAAEAGSANSYAERRQRLLERIREARARREQLSGEALKEHLQQQQMNALRKGQPPLPIPITPEMDDQLVKEGVLPPME
jgi:hypothetical protein